MNRDAYDHQVALAIAKAAETIEEGSPSSMRTRHALAVLAQHVASATRDYELSNLRTVDDLAAEFSLSPRRIRALAANRHARYGIGMQVGKTWLWSASEIDRMRPRKPGRPPQEKNGGQLLPDESGSN